MEKQGSKEFFSKRECLEMEPKPEDIVRHNCWITRAVLSFIFKDNSYFFS
jgi:hypothetical protein